MSDSTTNSSTIAMELIFDFSFYTKTLKDLLQRRKDLRIIIPAHQRNYVWDQPRQDRLIEAIIRRRALTGTILLRLLNNGKFTLEDGQQRLTTIERYVADKFKVNERLFSELEPLVQQAFLTFTMPVEQYEGATDEEAIAIFVQRQGGAPLSCGDKLWSMHDLSPIVKFARSTLLVNKAGLHERAKAVWGAQNGADKKRTRLLTAVALCSALAFGPNFMTKKWPDYQTSGILSREVDEPAVIDLLEKIIRILEDVGRAVPTNGKHKKKQWDPAFITGYIACDLKQKPLDDHERAIARWTAFLTYARQVNTRDVVDEVVHPRDDSARSWLAARWEGGAQRMYEFEIPTLPAAAPVPVDSVAHVMVPVAAPSEDDDEDDDEEDDGSDSSE